ncbi:Bug family tripartite tricarboxylate transporter substrate binding protein [Noviherbaspirillum aerium]|uniref:Bug family tripartite tricarboxylate transporter substrate binding protein n=1 Tax=Noviherbaspirillum aerium TaxID=2588497 RepID=UPI00124EDF27|nr:tripartite tricarboxylate transporter substrate binding protein [Noviherbaspirillum aerium]
MRRQIMLCLMAAPMLVAAGATHAQAQATQYPAKPIRLIVPYGTGGGTDIIARLYAQKLKDAWGQSVIVENRPGGDGIIGSEVVARSPADGYTLMLVVAGHVINPGIKSKMPFDVQTDFTPVTLVATSPWVIVTSRSLAVTTVKELVEHAKANPGKVSFGSSEPSSRLAGEFFRLQSRVSMVNIPYKGGAQIMTDVVGGHLDVGFTSVLTALQHYKSDRLRVLAVAGKSRSPSMPTIPTATESGLPGYETFAWYGMYAPAGTPKDIVGKIQKEVARISALPEVRERLVQLGAEPAATAPDEFAAFTRSEVSKYAKLIKDAGIQPD